MWILEHDECHETTAVEGIPKSLLQSFCFKIISLISCKAPFVFLLYQVLYISMTVCVKLLVLRISQSVFFSSVEVSTGFMLE